ncbi:MAG: methyltransferase domain-containing protein [Bradyrhizobium sp.]
MGISISYLWYLAEKDLLPRGGRILDVGTSYLYNLTETDAVQFCRHYGVEIERNKARELAELSKPRPGRQMLFLSQLLDVAGFEYLSYDVCPGVKTTVFDFNREELPEQFRGTFDLVLNFGTSEHIINQVNTFKVMHDALKVGGILFHQSPSIGWVDHGYFAYHPRFYRDLQIANDYEEIDMWMAKTSQCDLPAMDFREEEQPLKRGSGADIPNTLPCCNLNVIHRKKRDAYFRISLELSTSHSGISAEVRALHVEDPVVHQTRGTDLVASLIRRGAARLRLIR